MRKFKNILLLSSFILFTGFSISCSPDLDAASGVVISRTKPYSLQASKFIEEPQYHPPIKVLYRDSQIIAIIPERIIHSTDGVVTLDSIGVHHYAFLDLKTRKCSEYLNFSDTASLIKSYILADSISVIGGMTLFLTSAIPHVMPIEALADTVIKGVQYRRNKIYNTRDNYNLTWICYYRCDKKGTPVKYFGGQEKDGCPMTKYDVIIDEEIGDFSMELDYISSKLSDAEQKIFNAWDRNQKIALK